MTALASTGQLRAAFLRWALVLVPGILLLGFLSSALSGSGPGNPWFDALDKPGIYPAAGTFGLVWTALYVLMGLALAMVVTAWGARDRKRAIMAFAIQFLLNLAWAPLFFAAHQITSALVLLIVLDAAVIVTIVLFWKVRPLAGLLLVPYLGWILFATLLTFEFRQLNPDADGRQPTGAVQRIEL